MFDTERAKVEAVIKAYCAENHLPEPETISWSPIPFSGEWGMSTSFFQLAAAAGRSETSVGKIPVPQRAQLIASEIASGVAEGLGFSRVEATKGYLNLYYSSSHFTRTVVNTVIEMGKDFGRGPSRNERVMVEYAQPNTLHSFHMGHFRNAILGEALSRLVEFAGFPTIRASYPGDIGLGVITILWMYQRFYQGQEPEGNP